MPVCYAGYINNSARDRAELNDATRSIARDVTHRTVRTHGMSMNKKHYTNIEHENPFFFSLYNYKLYTLEAQGR